MSNKRKYSIDPKKDDQLKDEEINSYKDFDRLIYNYERATKPLYKKPLYKDPKTFLALLVLLLIVFLIMMMDEEKGTDGQAVPSDSTEIVK